MEDFTICPKIKIAIFASGGGSNAEKIIQYFKEHPYIEIGIVVSNKIDAGVLRIAAANNINSLIITKSSFSKTDEVVAILNSLCIDFVALAGFLWLVPKHFIDAFPNKILNIHPSLLPKYGGKGMYGHFVHEAVKRNNDNESGMTIHVVNEKFDDGNIIFQASCTIKDDMDANEIASEVLKLEHKHYPQVIEDFIKTKIAK
jgi:phosphoribosylglycinamide formyltransferase 1